MNYYNNPFQPQFNRMQQPMYSMPQQPIQQPMQQPIMNNIGLQGKSVDSIDVVKAMDINLDGSISYFPLTDGSAIVTKQLQMDGTSKTIIYKPIQEEEKKEEVKIDYLTKDDLDNTLRNEMNNVKNQIQIISENINELVNEMKNFKGGKK